HDLGQLADALGLPDSVAPDYVAYGPVFQTGTKKNPDPVVGLEGLAAARRRVEELAGGAPRRPLVAIGGLDP
ncbi:MAG TPA: thiamine phosphate synthase, partial [Myxococcota bacterium]|nr:thiamine phosphate synthase [Myxococcota bacterium]